MCPAKVPGEYEPTPALPHFPRPLNRQGQRSLSVFLLLSDPLQLWPATLNSETPPKSTGCRLAAWHLTESLAYLPPQWFNDIQWCDAGPDAQRHDGGKETQQRIRYLGKRIVDLVAYP